VSLGAARTIATNVEQVFSQLGRSSVSFQPAASPIQAVGGKLFFSAKANQPRFIH